MMLVSYGHVGMRRRLDTSPLNSTYSVALRRICRGDIDAPDIEALLRTVFILLTARTGSSSSGRTVTSLSTILSTNLFGKTPPVVGRRTHPYVMDFLVHDGRKYVFSPPSPTFLIGDSADRLALEAPDERNNLIKLVLISSLVLIL